MGFWNVAQATDKSNLQGMSVEFLQKSGCKVCPLNNRTDNKHPHMEPVGSTSPLVYMLGSGPGFTEDKKGAPFAGKYGELIKYRMLPEFKNDIRWNNVVRTKTAKNKSSASTEVEGCLNPVPIEIECCRPSIIQDIEETKPKAIFGFGNIPLQWIFKQNGITRWAGHYFPVQVGSHKCWYFPMLHPAQVIKSRRKWGDREFQPRHQNDYGSEIEYQFSLDLRRAFTLVNELPDPIVHTDEDAYSGIDFVTGAGGKKDIAKIEKFLTSIADDKIIGMDYETNRLRPYSDGAKILTVALASKSLSFAFPFHHQYSDWTPKQKKIVWSLFQEWLREAKCKKVVHNLAFEMEWTGFFFGKELLHNTKWGCSMAQAFVLDERRVLPSLDSLAVEHYGIDIKRLSKLDRKNLDNEPIEAVLKYNAIDSKYHRLIFTAQTKRLKAEELNSVYENHCTRIPTMVLTQIKGVPINAKVNGKFDRLYNRRLIRIERKIRALKVVKRYKIKTGEELNISSPAAVKEFIIEFMKRPIESADEEVLKNINHSFTKLLLRYRKAYKLLSTYVLPLTPIGTHENSAVYSDGKVHAVFNVNKVATTRTSSDSPNLQNFPSRGTGVVTRSQVTPGKNKKGIKLKVAAFDYAGIQARNVAMESKDITLIKAFWDRYDIHKDWMEKIIKHYPKWVEEGAKNIAKDEDLYKTYRNRAKNELVFPSFFGAQAKTVAGYLSVPENIGIALHEEFWDMFPDVLSWQKSKHKQYSKYGYVTSLAGYRRRAPISPNKLINAPIQADEAEIVCGAMTRLSRTGLSQYQANLEIHDDLTFIWPENKVEEYSERVIKEMLTVPYDWANIVPIGVEMAIGDNWAEKKKNGEYFSDLMGIVECPKEFA